jgi:hypothetical protein
MAADKDRYFIETVLQAGRVIKTIAESKEPVSAGDIVKAIGLSTNIAFRMCITLESLGWIRQIGDKYELGMGLALLWARKRTQLQEKIKTHTTELDALENPGATEAESFTRERFTEIPKKPAAANLIDTMVEGMVSDFARMAEAEEAAGVRYIGEKRPESTEKGDHHE